MGSPGSAESRRLLVSCGEPSGDLYAGELVRHLRERGAPLDVFGLGGDRLRAQEARIVAHVRDLAVVGLVEVLRHLRRLRSVFRQVLAEVDRQRPELAVLVDYAGFNLRLARELKARGIPVVYYVSPQVWAWRRGRVETIRDCVARMLVIFPFEEPFYRRESVPVTFVGHPLVDLVRPPADRRAGRAALGLAAERPLVAVLPGSRRQELAFNLPRIAAALRILRADRPDLQLALALAPGLDAASVRGPLEGLAVTLVPGGAHALMGSADAGIVASGTATVEAALLDLPSVVVYRVSRLSYALGRPFVHVPHYAMVNLIAGRELLPERIQRGFEPRAVARDVRRFLEDDAYRESVRHGLADVRAALGQPGASDRAASVVEEFLR